MKVRDDPRGAAELFCAQNGVTDPETIDLLEDTLRRLYLPAWSYTRASGPDPSNPDTWPPVPPKKKSQDSAASPGRTADKPGADSNNNQERPQPGRDDGVGGVHSSPVGTSEPAGASGARGDGAHTAGGGSRAASGLTDAATAHETFRAVDPTSHGAAGQPEQLQQQQQQQQQQQRGHQNQEPQGKGEDEQEPGGHPEARGGSNEAAAVAGGAPPPAVKTVMEVAQEMKAAAEALHDPADPDSLLVDLVVNGHPAPLLFRLSPRDGGMLEAAEGERGRRRQEKEEEELGEQAAEVATAARAWCREFGSDRAEDIAFVEAEIRKAIAAAEAAAAARAAEEAAATAAAKAESEAKAKAAAEAEAKAEEKGDVEGVASGEKQADTPAVAEDHPQSALENPAKSSPDGSQGRKARASTGAAGGRGGKETTRARATARAKAEERLTISSVLAPDVEKGTSIFWVKVDPSLPELYVTAGSSALELSQVFCRTYGLGPSQIPLVAWKLLDAYPAQMEAARSGGNLPPAEITLGYAASQGEVQIAAAVFAVAALLWVARRRRRGVFGEGTTGPSGRSHRRKKAGRGFGTRLLSFAPWAGPRQRKIPLSVPSGEGRNGKQRASSLSRKGADIVGANPPAAPAAGGHCDDDSDACNDEGVGQSGRRSGSSSDSGSRSGDAPEPPSPVPSSSWLDVALFESGRILGACVRAVILPLAYFSRGRISSTRAAAAAAAAATEIPAAASTTPAKAPKKASKKPGVAPSKASAKSRAGPAGAPSVRKSAAEVGAGKVKGSGGGGGGGAAANGKKAPFAGGDVQQAVGDAGGGKEKKGEEPVGGPAAAKVEPKEGGEGGAAKRENATWPSVLDGLAEDPRNRFSQTAILSNTGQVLAKSDGFAIETHEACDWARLFKNKKTDIVVGGDKFLVLSREEGTILVSNKALGSKMAGCRTKSGTAVLGTYADLSKSEAREGMGWLVDALSSGPVR